MKYRKVETFQKAVKKALKETASIFVEIKCSRFNQYTKTQEDFFVTSFTDMTSDKNPSTLSYGWARIKIYLSISLW